MDRVFATLFAEAFGRPPTTSTPVSAQGSKRRMTRLGVPDGPTAIAVRGPDAAENAAFVAYTRAFRAIDLPVPALLAEAASGEYLVEDLGDVRLYDVLAAAAVPGKDPGVLDLYRQVLDALVRFQVEGHAQVDYALAHPVATFDARAMRWDLEYFKYCFLKLADVPYGEDRLAEDFDRLVAHLDGAERDAFCYRDIQSRNVMVRDEAPWFLDYQGGRRGAVQYDVAKVLYEGRPGFDAATRETLLGHYLERLSAVRPETAADFRTHWIGFVLLRLLQGMGAYGYLGLFQRQAHFLASVPRIARTLAALADDEPLLKHLPELTAVFRRIGEDPRWAAGADGEAAGEDGQATSGLRVHVTSFSYRRGYPLDTSEHGGGLVFDCRALPNPGRDARFAQLTGLDPSVAAFLRADPACTRFYEGVQALVRPHVETFKGRGFTYLAVAFGCTGGQHRSVHFAERLATDLATDHPDVEVVVTHREAERWPVHGSARATLWTR